jgi:ABC-2 type transport system permease protein
MRLFIETVRRSFRRHLTYRAAMLAGLLTNVFFGLLKANVFLAFAASGNTTGWNDSNIMTYTALTQALIVFLSIFGSFDLMNRVYRGEIAGDLLKPTPLYGFYLAQDLGRAVAALLLRGLPLMVVMNLFFEITIPNSIIQWCIVVISTMMALVISFGFRFLVNLTAFWSPDARGIGRLAFTVSMFASGFLLPLRFLPEWLQHILAYTPFPSMVNTVIEVYLETVTGQQLLLLLGQQLLWAVGLIVLSQLVLRLGVRRLVILGG